MVTLTRRTIYKCSRYTVYGFQWSFSSAHLLLTRGYRKTQKVVLALKERLCLTFSEWFCSTMLSFLKFGKGIFAFLIYFGSGIVLQFPSKSKGSWGFGGGVYL